MTRKDQWDVLLESLEEFLWLPSEFDLKEFWRRRRRRR